MTLGPSLSVAPAAGCARLADVRGSMAEPHNEGVPMTSPPSKPKRGERAKPGAAGPGETFDPTQTEHEQTPEPGGGEYRPTPAPGVPVSDEQYEWLKRKAGIVRTPPSKHRQEDPSGKK
jgi:hypothetical protein